MQGLQLPHGDGWSTTHKLVGLSVLVHLTATSARRSPRGRARAGSEEDARRPVPGTHRYD